MMNLDSTMPFMERLLEPRHMEKRLSEALAKDLKLEKPLLLRHKPGKRCLIQYDLKDNQTKEVFSLLGKGRAKGLDERSFKNQKTLWSKGFSDTSPDLISVPEVLTCLPDLNTFLQKKIPGQSLSAMLREPKSVSLMPQVAKGLAKLQQTPLKIKRSHTLDDELELLEERLSNTSDALPELKTRIHSVMLGCEILANKLPNLPAHILHRDFYQDQVLISGERVFLLDFDLMAKGQAALDVGNFLAHLTEYGLRLGNVDYFAEHERLFLKSYLAHTDSELEPSIQIYKTISLVRHIFISTLFESRQAFTESLLALCENRLSLHHLKPIRSSYKRNLFFLNSMRLL